MSAMQRSKSFKTGESVYAKWPGSPLYYKGDIVSYDPEENEYSLKFENDDTIVEISASDIYKESLFQRKARSKSRSPSRRRSRSRSQNRVRRRSKSPGRKSSPTKSSPSPKKTRQPRSPARKVTQKLVQANKKPSDSVEKVQSEKEIAGGKITETVETVTTTTPNIDEIVKKDEIDSHPTNSSNHSTQSSEITTSVTRRTTRSVTRALQEEQKVIGEEACIKSNSNKLSCQITCTLYYVSSAIGHVVMMLLPLVFVCGMYLSCKKKTCTFSKLPKLPSINKLFNWKALAFVFGWYLVQALISLLPLGKVVAGPTQANKSKLLYRLNGFISLTVTIAGFAAMLYFKKFSTKFMINNYLAFVIAAFEWSFLISIVAYVLSRNSNDSSSGFIKDFVLGRSISPRFKKSNVDIKTYAFKAGCITWAVLNICYLMKGIRSYNDIKTLVQTNPSLALLVVFQVWYVKDCLFFEETLLYTASFSSEKLGFMSLSGTLMVFPFFCSMQARYLSLYPVSMPWYCYVVPVILQFSGYYIYRVSTLQKFLFRKDQHKAKLSGVSYITTANRKNLLVDGWWKLLQHPNYLGDLMMNFSWAMLCGFYHPIPWVWPVLLIVVLVLMCMRDDAKCKKKYGSSWNEYKQIVKYKIIPYVY